MLTLHEQTVDFRGIGETKAICSRWRNGWQHGCLFWRSVAVNSVEILILDLVFCCHNFFVLSRLLYDLMCAAHMICLCKCELWRSAIFFLLLWLARFNLLFMAMVVWMASVAAFLFCLGKGSDIAGLNCFFRVIWLAPFFFFSPHCCNMSMLPGYKLYRSIPSYLSACLLCVQ